MKQKQYRVWWPGHLSSCELRSHILLFGWCIHSSLDSVDFVVATGASEERIHQLDLEEVLDHVNKRMPESLKCQSTFRLLGYCGVHTLCDGNFNSLSSKSRSMRNNLQDLELEDSAASMSSNCDEETSYKIESQSSCWRKWTCGCYNLNGFNDWIQLENSWDYAFNLKWIPKLHHLHMNGQMSPVSHAHFIMYELPSFGLHHFSLSDWSSVNQAITPIKKPKWVSDLCMRQPLFDLDLVISALNCANTAKHCTEKHVGFNRFLHNCSGLSRLFMVGWHVLAAVLASFSTIIYEIFLLCHSFFSCCSNSFFLVILVKLFAQTLKNFEIRSSQFLYWPFFLQGSNSSFQPNVEYAHIASLRRHSIWSSIAFDLLLGNILGLLMLNHADDIFSLIKHISCTITDDLLRSGCVWLMGVPAGFKLNTELAELLGLVSLNAIQIWSTLWFYLGPLLRPSLIGLAFTGMFLGATIPVALCIDFLKLATLHVTVLHAVISFLYSRQIWVLTSLWRLFRGQKWNPLRLRLDSFDYSVEQHVVGSLLFTPILLLLPTTSVFYIFFTIVGSCISLLCILFELSISLIHITPYAEVFLWASIRGRFPSGVWLELRAPRHQRGGGSSEQPVSSLRSNYARLGQILGPHYRSIFGQVPLSLRSSFRGVLGGQRVPSTLGVGLPKGIMPWRKVKTRVYWRFCRLAVLSCAPKSQPSTF